MSIVDPLGFGRVGGNTVGAGRGRSITAATAGLMAGQAWQACQADWPADLRAHRLRLADAQPRAGQP
jgi:hypothetical protein